ncbi:MAG TPA: ABC transporter ATP-binding protein [Jatrophihabitans sp.]|nr:ABC transporter ATP-binding protein [Jatrophihabitans sp.]
MTENKTTPGLLMDLATPATETSEPADIAIEVRELSKKFKIATERRDSIKERFVKGSGRYDEFWALRDISLSIPRGSTFGLIGHNGSGKSTLLKVLAGIYRPTSGSLQTTGRISALLELGAGFHGELSGRENIYLNGAILGLSRKQIDESMDGIIAFAGLEDFIDTPVKVYSSGMYVRLGFSIAVTVDPEILIVDEIIAVGDEEFQRKCFDHLYELRRKGTTIVLVSHSLGVMADLCDQAAWLDQGRLKSLGPVRDVIDDYLGQVNRNEAAARVKAGAATEDDQSGRTARLGTGEVRVTRVEFLDADGLDAGFLATGEPGVIRMHFRAGQDLPSVTFGLGFTHESGVTVAGPNSGYGSRAMSIRAGSGYVDFAVAQFPLQPSTFLVSAAAADHGHVYDYRDRAFELRVRAHEAVTEPGITRMFGDWSLQQNAAPDGGPAQPGSPAQPSTPAQQGEPSS